MFERFTDQAIRVVMLSQEESRRMGHNFVGTEQILLGIISEPNGLAGITIRNIKNGKIRSGNVMITLIDARKDVERLVGRGSGYVAVEIPFTPRGKNVLEGAIEESRRLGHSYVSTEHILLALLWEQQSLAVRLLKEYGVRIPNLINDLMREMKIINRPNGKAGNWETWESSIRGIQGQNRPSHLANGMSKALSTYCTNLSADAKNGHLDPVIGRDTEIQRVIQILSRRRKNNPVLVGEPGVGKTAIAEGLALSILRKQVSLRLLSKKVISLDLSLLIAGTKYRGEFEQRLKDVIKEVQVTKAYILLIDEVHTLVGAGAAEGAIDAANILKPPLARGELQCVGATTSAEYRKYIERDPALERRFQPVQVDEPTILVTQEILQGLREIYEKHHRVILTKEALIGAAALAAQYIADRFLPDKAIDLIDEASARVRFCYDFNPPELLDLLEKLKSVRHIEKLAEKDKQYELTARCICTELDIRIRLGEAVAGLCMALIEEGNEQQAHILYWRFRFVVKIPKGVLNRHDRVVMLLPDEHIMKRKLAKSRNIVLVFNAFKPYLSRDRKLKNIQLRIIKIFKILKFPFFYSTNTKKYRIDLKHLHRFLYSLIRMVGSDKIGRRELRKSMHAHIFLNMQIVLRWLKSSEQPFESLFEDNNENPLKPKYTSPFIFEADIADVVSSWTDIPISKVTKDESKNLLEIEERLLKRVIGQDNAVIAISRAIRRARVGLRNPNRPIASFLFCGPTGVGKTEVTKALAADFFGSEDIMVRLDMSEYMERHTTSKLIGSPPGYVGYSEGGQLTEAVRRKAYTVILLDEVEKAHPDVFNLLLQVLEDGRLTDSKGRTIDFKNTILIMTSNLGAAAIQEFLGTAAGESYKNLDSNDSSDNIDDIFTWENASEEFTKLLTILGFCLPDNDDDSKVGVWGEEFNKNWDTNLYDNSLVDLDTNDGSNDPIKKLVNNELKKFFRPEFLNRLDEIIVFKPLEKETISVIADNMIEELVDRLSEKDYFLSIPNNVRRKLVEEGFDPIYGARPLRRVITRRLEDNLSKAILDKDLNPGSSLSVGLNSKRQYFIVVDPIPKNLKTENNGIEEW